MNWCRAYFAALFLSLGATASATTIVFDSDPFAGSNALITPGRQIVGGEPFISFDIASDVFAFVPSFFGVGNEIHFANDLVENLPASGLNVIVLQTAPIPFNAGLAANAIADQVTSPGPGFFIYFNSGLDLPRLVYSTDLDDATADLKILARMTNLVGQPGRDALPAFSASNFQIVLVPEPAGLLLMTGIGAILAGSRLRRRAGRG
jgi:hypothetical protein